MFIHFNKLPFFSYCFFALLFLAVLKDLDLTRRVLNFSAPPGSCHLLYVAGYSLPVTIS